MITTTRTTKTAALRPAKKTSTPRRTIEEKKAQAAALHESIATQVESLRDAERWTAFLARASAFHAYSLGNVLLILGQRPTRRASPGSASGRDSADDDPAHDRCS